jgi:hypothetical protein
MEKKYDYSISVTSADGYKCYISWSGCYLGKASIPFSAAGSWGGGGGGAVEASGPKMKPLPDTIRLVYYSLTEDQFYGLTAPLPQEKIRPLLEGRYKQLDSYYKDARYQSFTVGIAPCGFVSLWLGGGAGNILIDTFRAQKIDFSYRVAFPTRTWSREEALGEYTKSLYPFILKEMKQDSISSAYWESLNQSFQWKLAFSDDRFSLYNYDIYLLNSENRMYITDPAWPVTEGDKYVPAELTLYLKHELDPVKYKVIIKLRDQYIEYDDAEDTLNHMNKSRVLLWFFEAFYRKTGGKDVSVYVDFDDSMKSLKLKLRWGDYEEEFPDYEFEIYDSETYNYR